MNSVSSQSKSHLLDHLAITLAVLCAIHCLITPVLLVALPLIATTFWIHEDFHLWMIFLVFPTTILAILAGCRKHKDKLVLGFAAIGLCLLVFAFFSEQQHRADVSSTQSESFLATDNEANAHVGCCPVETSDTNTGLVHVAGIHWFTLLNTVAGLFLIAGHFRNYRLCRKVSCEH